MERIDIDVGARTRRGGAGTRGKPRSKEVKTQEETLSEGEEDTKICWIKHHTGPRIKHGLQGRVRCHGFISTMGRTNEVDPAALSVDKY